MARLMLIDGNSLTYRAFFALPTDMATASGQVTNAVYGFTSMLVNLLKDHQPDQVVATFDRPEPTFRHEMIADYKAGRAQAPDILRQQMGLVRQVIETLRIPLVELVGYEADDLIATLATQAAARGDDVIIVTGDRDTYQLVEDPHVKVLYNRRGVSDYVLYDEEGIQERTGVTPAVYPEYAALRGDPSDNLPGVPGVGEKTAARLINTYGDLDGIYAHLDELTPKLRQSLADAEAVVRANATATPLRRDVPLDIDWSEAGIGGWDLEALRRLFDFLEFRTLWDRFIEATDQGKGAGPNEAPAGAAIEVSVEEISDPAAAVQRATEWQSRAVPMGLAGGWEGREGRSPLRGLAFAPLPPAAGPVQVVWFSDSVLEDATARAALSGFLGEDGVEVSAHDAKALMRGLAVMGVVFCHSNSTPRSPPTWWTRPAISICWRTWPRATQAWSCVRPDAPPPGQLDLTGGGADMSGQAAAPGCRRGPPRRTAQRRGGRPRDVEAVRRGRAPAGAGPGPDGGRRRTGGRRAAAPVGERAGFRGPALEQEIQDLAGTPFVVNSTPQLREILFDKLGLTPQKKTKTGYLDRRPNPGKAARGAPDHRGAAALPGSGEAAFHLWGVVAGGGGADGRIHATFNQTVARTGRLSPISPTSTTFRCVRRRAAGFGRALFPRRMPVPGRRLQPDRATGHRPPGRRPRA